MSEVNSCRERLAPFCTQCGPNGLDLGFGGTEPIVPTAICVDREPGHPHRAAHDEWPTHLVWDVFSRLPFDGNTFDYVFSSHTLEDAEDTAKVLQEWLRVIKPGGNLVLFLPDQKAYVEECRRNGSLPNQAHKHPTFSLDWVKWHLPKYCPHGIIHELFPVPNNPYSFDLVIQHL